MTDLISSGGSKKEIAQPVLPEVPLYLCLMADNLGLEFKPWLFCVVMNKIFPTSGRKVYILGKSLKQNFYITP